MSLLEAREIINKDKERWVKGGGGDVYSIEAD